MDQRETSLRPSIRPDYFKGDIPLVAFRMVCVDRIWHLAWLRGALHTTAFAAIRLFDRCMSIMRPPFVRTNMSLLCVAAFDICFKAIDGDINPPSKSMYYYYGFKSKYNDYTLEYSEFGAKLREIEITVLDAVSGEPVAPTPYDYISECCPSWDVQNRDNPWGRRASLAVAAFSYGIQSTEYTSMQIASAAVSLALGDLGAPSVEMFRLLDILPRKDCSRINVFMGESIDSLFGVGSKCMLHFLYDDMYEEWSRARASEEKI